MATQTTTIGTADITISDDSGETKVTVAFNHEPSGQVVSNTDTAPEWSARIGDVPQDEIETNPTVVRLLTARPGPA